MFLSKRSRPGEAHGQGSHEVRFTKVTIYLVERRMGRSRRRILTNLARSKGFYVEDILSGTVTHIVAEGNPAMELWLWLRAQGLPLPARLEVLDISWFTESMQAGEPVPVETRHRIQDSSQQLGTVLTSRVSQYACQRRTTLDNRNKIFTDAFEVLVEHLEFSDSKGPCLAFKRAASVLKSLPSTLRHLGDADGLPCLGEHCRDIFECGKCSRVEDLMCNEKFRTMKLFTSVFGVGPKTAEKWYHRGLRTLQEVVSQPNVHLNKMQRAGLLYYRDISRGISRAEADAVGRIIAETMHCISPSATMTLTGGFRRGKAFGHDVDYILSTPESGAEEALLLRVIDRLRYQGILLYCDYQESTFDKERIPCRRFEAMDHFPKCFLILKLDAMTVEDGGLQNNPEDQRGWRAVRVDLVAPPADRYAYTLLGWTGSTQFERDLRRFARLERGMLLDNHALYDRNKSILLPAKTEEDIFAHLGLEYIEPWQRNA
uniref:DNA-directed DNA/RNA polymerase mu n=1 Tax=Denticeps clupeoides TaxID=299321 RepID=A0AAY4ELW3_9TELE